MLVPELVAVHVRRRRRRRRCCRVRATTGREDAVVVGVLERARDRLVGLRGTEGDVVRRHRPPLAVEAVPARVVRIGLDGVAVGRHRAPGREGPREVARVSPDRQRAADGGHARAADAPGVDRELPRLEEPAEVGVRVADSSISEPSAVRCGMTTHPFDARGRACAATTASSSSIPARASDRRSRRRSRTTRCRRGRWRSGAQGSSGGAQSGTSSGWSSMYRSRRR